MVKQYGPKIGGGFYDREAHLVGRFCSAELIVKAQLLDAQLVYTEDDGRDTTIDFSMPWFVWLNDKGCFMEAYKPFATAEKAFVALVTYRGKQA
jgi:hypothetical protein